MRFLREAAGLALVVFAWVNPLGLDFLLRAVVFILGFDLMGMALKIAVFGIDFLVGFGQLGLTLLVLVAAEAVLMLLKKEKIALAAKPAAVFAAGLFSIGLEPALIAAGLDLLINIGVGK